MYSKEEVQKLIDACFEMVLLATDKRYKFNKMSNEEKAKWVAMQLSLLGFETEQRGMSWGVLV